jgi:hypothetical protein
LFNKLTGQSSFASGLHLKQKAKMQRQIAFHERLAEIIRRPDLELKRQDVGKRRAPRQAIVVYITRA